jgi:hypothetical protein
MQVTIFKDISTTEQAFHRDIDFVLDRIKRCHSRELIEIIRNEKDKKIRDKSKMSLPSICFSGTFKKRAIKGLIEHSGLICIDFDGFEDEDKLSEYRSTLTKDAYSFSVFLSPSGNGLKVLVKIPPMVDFHKKYFETLQKYYASKHFDKSTSDVSRVCYESCDEDIYINKDSVLWEELPVEEIEEIGTMNAAIPLTSEYEIIERLNTWFAKNYTMIKGERNDNLFKLAAAFNTYGVAQTTCESSLRSFANDSFPVSEIENTVRSAYKKASDHGTKSFEDSRKKDAISTGIKNGKTREEIRDETGADDKEIQKVRKSITTETFWEYGSRGGLKLSHYDYKLFLEEEGYSKYYPSVIGNHTLIKIKESNIIQNVSTSKIRDYVLSYLRDRLSDMGKQPFNFMAESTKYFKEDFLSMISSKDVKFKRDSKSDAFLYFKNHAIKVTSNDIKKIDYIDLEGFIWENQIIQHDHIDSDKKKSVYEDFIMKLSGDDSSRYDSIRSTIGFLLHSHKSSKNNKAVILNDETISDKPNGGSGKGLFCKALGHLRRVSIEDGKRFSLEKTFCFQKVSLDTQILQFDDVKRNFDFENLFPVVTEGLEIEKKNKDAVFIPFELAPKIVITTNYTIGGIGGSFDRRKHELEFSDFFSDKHSPYDEYDGEFFTSWDSREWMRFYSFMISCLQFYLKDGLIASSFKNLAARKFIKETCSEFYEWVIAKDVAIASNTRHTRSKLMTSFTEEYPDYATGKFKISQRRFNGWCQAYAKFIGSEYNEGNTQGVKWLSVDSSSVKKSEEKVNSTLFEDYR